ncbi:MAG TPA: exonuclease domain-containing protein [Symbiobacteriaceae bacterium]|nr:exonuclease domain-containing protein [Symbiobacteriaceae bacterium]
MAQIAVIDVETTGLNPHRHDRIVELAAVVINPDGTLVREFVTLVNPDRDMGPTHIHGLTARDTHTAPRFHEAAPAFIAALTGCAAVAGHNIRFDLSFLEAEFGRMGCRLPDFPTLCTMQMAGGSLTSACAAWGITFDGAAHTALHDTRATARLLAALLRKDPDLAAWVRALPPITWPTFAQQTAKLLTREEARQQPAVTEVAATAQVGFRGKTVCFTGEGQCRVNGSRLTREMAADLAARHGLTVTEAVTKKLDLLVAADPFTQSGKAKKARQYGIPVVHEAEFWKALGLKVR